MVQLKKKTVLTINTLVRASVSAYTEGSLFPCVPTTPDLAGGTLELALHMTHLLRDLNTTWI